MLMMTVVPTASATDGQQLVGDAEHRPDRADVAGPDEVAPTPSTTSSGRDRSTPGSQSGSRERLPHAADELLQRKRPTRVPASIVVRMNSASNMIAKWYQYAIRPVMPGRPLKICAMPTASDTAPPVRPATFSPTWRCSIGQIRPASCRACANTAGGVLMAK